VTLYIFGIGQSYYSEVINFRGRGLKGVRPMSKILIKDKS